MKPAIPVWLRGVIGALLMSQCVTLFFGIVYSQSSPNLGEAPATLLLTPAPSITPTKRAYTIRGHVAEFPPCQGSMRSVTVHLDPLGLTAQTDLLPGGDFSFANIPNGIYTARVRGCNPFGCWVDTPVTVNGADADAHICMATFTPTPTVTPIITPIPTVAPTFEVKVNVILPKTTIHVGEIITSAVTIENRSVGCQYPVYDLTLSQQGATIFRFDSPTVISPPVSAQTVYTLTAITPGVATLRATAYGERNCNDFWQWTYVTGDSAPLTVTPTQTHIVTTTADSGPGSLRQLIADIAPGDTIRFDKLLRGQIITLSNQLWVTKSVTIDGSTLAQPITLNGNNQVRVLAVAQTADVTLMNLVIANGRVVKPFYLPPVPSATPFVLKEPTYDTGFGAGLLNDGHLALHAVVFHNNRAGITYVHTQEVGERTIDQNQSERTTTSPNFPLPSGNGGALYNNGVLIITHSTFQANRVFGGTGGAVENHGQMNVYTSSFVDNQAERIGDGYGGAIYNTAQALIVNSTFSHNQTFADLGGGPHGGAIGNIGTLWINNSTFDGNSGGSTLAADGTVHLYNSIIAGSVDSVDCQGTLTTNINTLIEDGSCGATLTGDPKLGPLANNGGVQTYTLLPGSPALDAGDNTTCSSTDQRGSFRPQDGDGDGVARCDIGAVEASPIAPGDGNGDGKIDAGDLTACVLEIFDDDGNFWLDAPGGTFAGTVGCDANRDTVIDSGDLTCTVLLIFNGPNACGARGLAVTQQPAQLTIGAAVAAGASAADNRLAVPVMLTSNGHPIAAVTFGLALGDTFDPTDSNGDGLPDTVQRRGLSDGVSVTTTWHAGNLNVMIADQSVPFVTLVDGPLLTILVDSVSPVAFVETTPPSLGNVTGQSVPVQMSTAAIIQLYLPVVQR